MKPLIIIAGLALCAGCNSSNVRFKADDERPKVDSYEFVLGGCTFTVLELEGHKYLSRYQGGIVHMESCACRTNAVRAN